MNIWNIRDKEDPMPSQLCKNIIFVAMPQQLSCKACYQHLWRTAVLLPLSGGRWVIAIEELFRDAEHLGIEFRYPNGQPFEIPYIFDVFGDDLDSARRGMNNFLKADSTGTKPDSHCRCLLKLQCIELLLQCTVAKYRRGPETPLCSFSHYPLGW